MKPISKRILTVIVALMVLSFFTGEVQAADYGDTDDSLMVSIESADYLDLDGDQMDDDIFTEFTIAVPEGDWDFDYTYIYCKLVLPSGNYFHCLFLMIGSYNSVTITLAWYNTALESGWYTFSLWVWGCGPNAPEMGYDTLDFDPPEVGDPGIPSVEIIRIIV